MKNFAELVMNRRSIRQYTNSLLLPSDVEQIMKSALMAPSSKNSRSWQFILVENKETLKKLSACKPSGALFVQNCALAIIVLTDPMQTEAYLEDAAITAAYIQLQAEDLGLGSCWIQITGRETENGYDSEQYVKDLLDIPLSLSICCIIAVGHKVKAVQPHSEENIEWEKIHIEKYKS
jgi:nitroreductase